MSMSFQRSWGVDLQGHQPALSAHGMQAAAPCGLVWDEMLQVVAELILTL